MNRLGGCRKAWTTHELAQEARTEGAHLTSAACSVCRRVFTLTKIGLVRTHGPVDNRCSGSRAPPDSKSAASAPLDKVQQGLASPVQGEEEDLQRLPNRYAVKILKRIPHGSQEVAARKLASVVEAAVAKNDQSSWNRLLRFTTHCLRAPKRGGRRWNLVREINEQIRAESDPPPVPSHLQTHPKRPKTRDPLEALASLVASKLEEGNLKGTVHLAHSQETIADTSDKTLAALHQKHPPPHPDTRLPPPPEDSSLVLLIMEEAVATAIRSFPNGSAGGPDGLSPQHLKDMIGASAQGGWSCFAESPDIPDQCYPPGQNSQGSASLLFWSIPGGF